MAHGQKKFEDPWNKRWGETDQSVLKRVTFWQRYFAVVWLGYWLQPSKTSAWRKGLARQEPWWITRTFKVKACFNITANLHPLFQTWLSLQPTLGYNWNITCSCTVDQTDAWSAAQCNRVVATLFILRTNCLFWDFGLNQSDVRDSFEKKRFDSHDSMKVSWEATIDRALLAVKIFLLLKSEPFEVSVLFVFCGQINSKAVIPAWWRASLINALGQVAYQSIYTVRDKLINFKLCIYTRPWQNALERHHERSTDRQKRTLSKSSRAWDTLCGMDHCIPRVFPWTDGRLLGWPKFSFVQMFTKHFCVPARTRPF